MFGFDLDYWEGVAPPAGVPLLAKPVPAGFPSAADDRVEGRISLDQHLMPHPEATFLMKVAGDSMRDQGIHDGDLVVVDRTRPARAGDVVIAVLDGQFMVKQYCPLPDGVLLRSANNAHGDVWVSGDVHLTVWGVVRWAVHPVSKPIAACSPASH